MPNPAASALDIANLSHPGMVRAHNEDAIFVDGAGLAVLADGMGGYNAGEVASGIAVSVIKEGLMPELVSGRDLSKVDVHTGLTHAALAAAAADRRGQQGHLRGGAEPPRMRRHGHDDRRRRVPWQPRVDRATSATRAAIGCAASRFEQLTRDHSLLQEQIDSGQITADQARLFAQQEPGDARARHRGDRAGRHLRISRRSRRHLSAVLGRTDRHGRHRGRARRGRRAARDARSGRGAS